MARILNFGAIIGLNHQIEESNKKMSDYVIDGTFLINITMTIPD